VFDSLSTQSDRRGIWMLCQRGRWTGEWVS